MRAWRLAFAALAAAAVIDIVVEGLPHASFSIANFFSYFTIESNLAGIVVLSAAAVRVPMPPRFEAIRGAVTLYLVVTGIIYNALLRDVGVGIAAEWTNVVVHLVMPVVVLFDWLLVPPARAIAARTALIWLAYPLCYLAYSLARGPIVDWYPYPFIDPGHHGGYGRVAAYAVVLAAVMGALAIAVAWLGTTLRRAHDRRVAVEV